MASQKEGIYYTPRYIVDYIVAHTLGEKINQFSPRPRLCSAIKISRVRPPNPRTRPNQSPRPRDGSALIPAWARLTRSSPPTPVTMPNAAQHKSERNGGGMLSTAPDAIAEEVKTLRI